MTSSSSEIVRSSSRSSMRPCELTDDFKEATPARVREKIECRAQQIVNSIRQRNRANVLRSFKGPVNNEGSPFEIIHWDKTPGTTIAAIIAIIPHSEQMPFGHGNGSEIFQGQAGEFRF